MVGAHLLLGLDRVSWKNCPHFSCQFWQGKSQAPQTQTSWNDSCLHFCQRKILLLGISFKFIRKPHRWRVHPMSGLGIYIQTNSLSHSRGKFSLAHCLFICSNSPDGLSKQLTKEDDLKSIYPKFKTSPHSPLIVYFPVSNIRTLV